MTNQPKVDTCMKQKDKLKSLAEDIASLAFLAYIAGMGRKPVDFFSANLKPARRRKKKRKK